MLSRFIGWKKLRFCDNVWVREIPREQDETSSQKKHFFMCRHLWIKPNRVMLKIWKKNIFNDLLIFNIKLTPI